MRRFLGCALACLLAWSGVCLGQAFPQTFPSKPMRILVSSPPGSSPDIRARQIGAKLAESLGQPVNRRRAQAY